MVNYMKQRKDYDCSPTAVVNAYIWCNGSISTISKNILYKMSNNICNTKEDGTSDYKFDKALRWAGSDDFIVKKPKKFTVKEVIEHINDGGAVALSHRELWTKEGDWHHSIFIGKKWGFFIGVNVKAGKKYFLCRKSKLEKLLTTGDNNENPEVWFLTKKT